jgi:predicted RNA-binding Zn-ribbon protein involved in translation (DUF1610 family)
MSFHPRIWSLVTKMYLYCYESNVQNVLRHLRLEHDFANVNNINLATKFAKLKFDDAIKVLEEILQDQHLQSQETERLEIENFEFSRFLARNSVPGSTSRVDPPQQKKESGEWRRQLIEYLRKDGFIYNESNGKLQPKITNQSIDNLKPVDDKIVIPRVEVYYHVRVRIDRGSSKPEDLHRFNLNEAELKGVVQKYNEEGIDNFYFEGRKIYPSDGFFLKIYCTWFDKLNNVANRYDALWSHVEKKGKDVTTEYIQFLSSNPWIDKSQICLEGHIINSSHATHREKNKTYCPECGKLTIIECQNCKNPLSGDQYKPYFQAIGMRPPSYCENCGKKFPWQKALSQKSEEGRLSGSGDALSWVKWLLSRFHSIVKTLESRGRDRKPLEIHDEYDVQYLLMALLRIQFSNVITEGWTPPYAGSSKRMDFIMKDEKIVIETKMTRTNLSDSRIGDELIVDIGHYKQVAECKNLFCFIYDPNSRLTNPQGLRDLERENSEEFAVHIIVGPQIH